MEGRATNGAQCIECSAVLPAGDEFCGKCGTRIESGTGLQGIHGESRPTGGLSKQIGGLGGVIVIVVLSISAVIATAIMLSSNPLGGPSDGFTGFRISASGCWSGAFGNIGSSSSIGGCGSRDIAWRCDGVLSGVAQKDDDGPWTLTLQVFVGGRIAEAASTSESYGVASAASSC